MNHLSACHQLGRFIVMCQHLEGTVNEFIYRITDIVDDPATANLGFTRRIDATDRVFSEFVDARAVWERLVKLEFHVQTVNLKALADRRNVLVHPPLFRRLACAQGQNAAEVAKILTPRSIVRALAAGFAPIVYQSASK